MKASLAIYSHFTIDVLPGNSRRIGGPPTYILRGIPLDREDDLQITVVSSLSSKDAMEFSFLGERAFLFLEFTQNSTTFYFDPTDMYGDMRLLSFAGELHQVVSSRLAIVSPVFKEVPLRLLEDIRGKTEILWVDAQGYFRYVDEEQRVSLRIPDNVSWLFRLSDLVKLSLDEARVLTGKEKTRDIIHALREIALKEHCVFVVTKGREGVSIIEVMEGKAIVTNVWFNDKVNVKDTTGAGDSFMGGLAYSFLTDENESMIHHARFATCVSTLVIQDGKPTTTLRKNDVSNCLDKIQVNSYSEN